MTIGPAKFAGFGKAIARDLRGGFLFGVMIENRGAILGAHVRSLTIGCGGIMHRPERVKQRVISDFRRIVLDFDGFRVSRAIRAHVLVGGIVGVAADITDRRGGHSRKRAEVRFNAPKTTRRKCCFRHRNAFYSANRLAAR